MYLGVCSFEAFQRTHLEVSMTRAVSLVCMRMFQPLRGDLWTFEQVDSAFTLLLERRYFLAEFIDAVLMNHFVLSR